MFKGKQKGSQARAVRRKGKEAAIILALLLGTVSGRAAIAIDGFSSDANDRFANNAASFIGANYNWSGVGRTTSSRWGTLVSRNVFISANHYHPAVDSLFEFYPDNDPNATPVTRTVASGQRIGTSDVWVGVLSTPVPESIATYDFPNEQINNFTEFTHSSIYEEVAWMWGLSPTVFSVPTDMAVGRNMLDNWYDHDTNPDDTLGDDAIMAVRNLSGDKNYVSYEAYLQSGDSGGPLFTLDTDDQLLLTGINWFIDQDVLIPGLGSRDISGFSYLGNYANDIQTIINAHPVPEPEISGMFVGIVVMTVGIFRRRQKTNRSS